MQEDNHLTIREFENHAKYMKSSMDDLKINMEYSFKNINNKLDDLPDKFVTKDEFHPLKTDVSVLKDTIRGVVMYIITTLITAVAALSGYIWHILIK